MPGLNRSMPPTMTVLPFNKSKMTSENNQMIFPQSSIEGITKNTTRGKGFRSLLTQKYKNSHNSANKGVRSVLRPVLKTAVSAPKKTRNRATPQNLPPPRPHKLTIPVPKCQHAQQHNDTRIQLTPDEIDKYCRWIPANKVKANATVKEAALVQTTDKTTYTANAVLGYIPQAVPYLITYYHAAAGYPIKATWI